MAVFDTRMATQLFNAFDARNVAFGTHVSHSSTSYVWNTTGHDRIHIEGVGITVDGNNLPTGGTVKKVSIDLNADGDIDGVISGVNVALTGLVESPDSFWQSLLKGHDVIYAPATFGGVMFGDFLNVIGDTTVIGGRDTLAGGTGAGQNLYGDAQAVGAHHDLGGAAGTLTGGRDTIVANNTTGNSLIIGDARVVEVNGRLNGNGDILTGSNTQGDTIIGDAERVFNSTASCGNDIINGRGGDDLLIGDVRDVQRFPGAADGPSVAGRHDLINGGDGDDAIYGDFVSVSDNQVGAISNASCGNDRLYGNDGNDVIYGDLKIGNDAITIYGRDQIYGGAGNDIIYGDAASFSAGLPPDANVGGHDLIYGGTGNDFVDGGVGNDRIFGEAGMDTLIGGFGNDQLTGGADADVFRFETGSGLDRILDFEDEIDTIEISASYGYADAAAVIATASVSGSNITLHLSPTDKITLLDFGTDPNVLLNDITII